jgi:hypothetical protein
VAAPESTSAEGPSADTIRDDHRAPLGDDDPGRWPRHADRGDDRRAPAWCGTGRRARTAPAADPLDTGVPVVAVSEPGIVMVM